MVKKLHIPDGWVDPVFLLVTWIIVIVVIAFSLNKLREHDPTRIAYMAVLGGTIFAAQMLNFPILGGTSGHMLGGALAAAIVGPWGAVLVMAIVLLIQALLFADGGILALGPNIFNMGVVGVFVGYIVLRYLMLNASPEENKIRYYSGVFIGAFSSVVVASFFAAIEIGVPILVNPSAIPLMVALPTILFYHILIGIGEGIISTIIVLYFNYIEMNVFIELEKPSLQLPGTQR
jgi:cobalt/nickel transport system permease protein